MSEPLLIWQDCGCVTHTVLGLTLPCSQHSGVSVERQLEDEEQHAWEAAAMNGWTDAPRR